MRQQKETDEIKFGFMLGYRITNAIFILGEKQEKYFDLYFVLVVLVKVKASD